MRMLVFTMLVAALAAGCSSKPKELDYRRECPVKLTQAIMANQHALTLVQVNKTRIRDLKDLGRPARRATLVHAGMPDLVLELYPTELASCPFMLPGPTYTPVVLDREGVIIGMGMDDMDDLHTKGWRVMEAGWPWQDYDYAYLPHK